MDKDKLIELIDTDEDVKGALRGYAIEVWDTMVTAAQSNPMAPRLPISPSDESRSFLYRAGLPPRPPPVAPPPAAPFIPFSGASHTTGLPGVPYGKGWRGIRINALNKKVKANTARKKANAINAAKSKANRNAATKKANGNRWKQHVTSTNEQIAANAAKEQARWAREAAVAANPSLNHKQYPFFDPRVSPPPLLASAFSPPAPLDTA
jgi:hypothetical protein